jgi:molybdopterin-containing oxidoreductase family iron-sulfur binding subunit
MEIIMSESRRQFFNKSLQKLITVAVGKPNEAEGQSKTKYGFVIDLKKCIGCDACTVACKAENKTPPGVTYCWVVKDELGKYPNVREKFTPMLCHQCDIPPCVQVCPVKATYKMDNGIVVIDYERCIGCRYCLTACPYGARYSDFGRDLDGEKQPNESAPTFEYGIERTREKMKSPIGNARKCHWCYHRIKVGMEPACVEACLGKARFFGDLNDPTSSVSQMIVKGKANRLREELGTEPSLYYLEE